MKRGGASEALLCGGLCAPAVLEAAEYDLSPGDPTVCPVIV